ncbi:transcription factor IIIB 90 kDa subunit [Cimex lectularius]|uniref:B-related factor 1 n=1 Tax=Cimex lectularius TaxID=79782 RepID=A0A8I6RNK3_CIMLE|nr:transcription factor IIIB 90 kDa subunit [Cimex lectularius]
MGAGSKCNSCGSSELEVDPSRGDTVCTNCGTVLEDSVIVSEVQFEENSHGISSAIGQFVSSDSSGGCRGFGNNFHSGGVRESRDITLENAKRGITTLSQNLRLNQHCIDTAFNFYKMALSRHLTRGRKHTHIVAACVYITCRIEGTPHLLIDFSDVLQICAFELGRTYLKLSQALCINVPALDPCMYVLRFANKLEFGEKTHEVTMTALRLVQRMKRDSMHYGRRPSGICGAALLMAARLHEFNRTVGDIVKVVQVHETTLRKRLVEFGETPSSSLTLTEFMTVDLEEEQDPPSYKAARAKDRERLKGFEDKERLKQFARLQSEIEKHIIEKKKRKLSLEETTNDEEGDLNNFISQSTLDILENIEEDEDIGTDACDTVGLGPSIESMGLVENHESPLDFNYECIGGELDTEGLDDSELDAYIMTEGESEGKGAIWTKNNADYLKAKQEKEEKLRKEQEDGKAPDKKKRRIMNKKKASLIPANSAGEAIEKMLQEKKISTKINYDVLKSLKINLKPDGLSGSLEGMKAEVISKEELLSSVREQLPQEEDPTQKSIEIPSSPKIVEKSKTPDVASPQRSPTEKRVQEMNNDKPPVDNQTINHDDVDLDDDEFEAEEAGGGVMSVAQMLSQYNGEEDCDGNYYDYDDDDY